MERGELSQVPPWTNMLLDTLEYHHGHQNVSFEMAGAAKGASRWDAIDPTVRPSDETADEVFPGLYVKKPFDKKKPVLPDISESVRRELSTLITQKLGVSGIELYSLDTDIEVLMDGFCEGVNAIGSEMVLDDKVVMGGAPLTTVEHDNEQLWWGRVSRSFPEKKVPTCIYGKEGADGSIYMPCYAYSLRGNQGALQMWLSPSQQNLFDDTGELPHPGPCLLCQRKCLQKLVLAYGTEINMMRMAGKRLVVPPWSILVDHPGGYSSRYCITPGNSQVVTTPFPLNSGTLTVQTNEAGTRWYIDQGELVYNVQAESSN